MKTKKLLCAIQASTIGLITQNAYSGDSIKSTFNEGSVSGNVRAYYNTRDYKTREDEAGFALGGALRAETGYFHFIKFGLGYYTAHDLGLNDDDPDKVNKRLGDELETLGEAYATLKFSETTITGGRQKIKGPWANPGDAFITPFTFNAYSLKSNISDDFTINADYIMEIRNRNSEDFVDVGEWNSARYGVDGEGTSGTLNLGVTYSNENTNAQLWYTDFAEFFSTVYASGKYNFSAGETTKPFIGIQYAIQSDSGDAKVGDVSSSILGIQGGSSFGKMKLTLAYNLVDEDTESFRNGAFLSPYTFSTSPLFTNSMLGTMENVDAGSTIKGTFNYNVGKNIAIKASYATLDFETATDITATNFDFTYKFSGYYEGFSLRYRVEIIGSDVEASEQTNNRFQAQFVF